MTAPVIYLIDAFESLVKTLDQETAAGKLLLALTPLFLLLLLPVSWNGNEENYFQLAYRRVAPQYFSEFHAAFDQSKARVLTEYLLGNLIRLFNYDRAHSIARVTMALLYAASFSVLFAALNLSVLRSVIVIVLFRITGEQLFGGEWLFKGVESKTFAYAAVVSAFGMALGGRWLVATILIGIASYFHFLVGGFWAIGLAVLAFMRETSFQKGLPIFLIYTLIVSPLLVLIAFEQLGWQLEVSGLSPDSIYAMRVPHHVAPFYGESQFWEWTTGVVTVITMTLAFLVLANRARAPIPPSFILILLLYLVLALVISFIDKHTFLLSKFYLFRPSSLILLLAIATVLSVDSASQEMTPETTTLVLRLSAFVVASVFLWAQIKSKLDTTPQTFPDLPSLISTIEAESKPTEIVLLEPTGEMGFPHVGLHRRIPRPTLVSWKFVPTMPADLLRWHNLIEYRKQLFQEGCRKPFAYPVRLLLVFEPRTLDIVRNCGDMVSRGGGWYLVRIDDRWIVNTMNDSKGATTPIKKQDVAK